MHFRFFLGPVYDQIPFSLEMGTVLLFLLINTWIATST